MDESTQLIMPDLNLVAGKDNKELCSAVLDMFQTVPQGMTAFQIQNFVLSDKDFPTVDSKWWQAKLELWVRLQNVIQMHYDHRTRSAKIKELKADIMEQADIASDLCIKDYEMLRAEAIAERLTVEVEENEFSLAMIQKGIGDKMKEMDTFWQAMQDLEGHMQFSKEDKEEQEVAFWTAKSRYDAELTRRFPEIFAGKQKY